MSAVKILTTRPSDDLGQMLNWAIENDVEDSLKLLVDCTVIRERINLLPTIIDRLSSKNCLETLCRWSKSDSYSYHLYKLIVSFQSDPYVTSNSNILSEHKPAKSQFYSYLQRWLSLIEQFSLIYKGISCRTPSFRCCCK